MEFNDIQIERYSRQIILPEIGAEGQERLSQAKVLVIGMGGLGSPISLYLAASGVGTLGLADFDTVDYSNLQRQILHGEKNVGQGKVDSAVETLSGINSEINLTPHKEKITQENILDVIKPYDFVLEGSDNFNTKYLTNDACILSNKPFSMGGILKYEGQLTTVVPGESPCYRCLFSEPPPADQAPTCATAGILSPVAGLLGSLQAIEALKYITQVGELLTGHFLTIDVKSMNFQKLKFSKSDNCVTCGKNPRQTLVPIGVEECQP